MSRVIWALWGEGDHQGREISRQICGHWFPVFLYSWTDFSSFFLQPLSEKEGDFCEKIFFLCLTKPVRVRDEWYVNDHRCSYVSIRFHPVLKPIACVAWRFWLGELSNEDGRGHKNRAEIGAGAIFIFLAASRVNFAARGFAARAPRSTKPLCYAGY